VAKAPTSEKRRALRSTSAGPSADGGVPKKKEHPRANSHVAPWEQILIAFRGKCSTSVSDASEEAARSEKIQLEISTGCL